MVGEVNWRMSSDYERYIRTDELLALQKEPHELINHDEMLFQLTHQSSELWMKAVLLDLEEAARLMHVTAGENRPGKVPESAQSHRYPPLQRATHLLRRSGRILSFLAHQALILEDMSPADYHQIRLALGRGSGQDSPGFNRILMMAQPLSNAYKAVLAARSITPVEILGNPYEHGELHALVQALMEVDEQFSRFRQVHLALVRRQIGLDVLSLKGVPSAKLVEGTRAVMFKDLWDAVSDLTNSLNLKY